MHDGWPSSLIKHRFDFFVVVVFPKPTGAAGAGDLGAGELNRTPSVLFPPSPSSCSDRHLSHGKRAASVTSSLNEGVAQGMSNAGHWRGSRCLSGASTVVGSSGFDIRISSEREGAG